MLGLRLFQLLTFFAAAPGAKAVSSACKNTFFGLIPWYQYLNLGPAPQCAITSFHILPDSATKTQSDIPLVLIAVVDDLLRVAGMVAVGFVIYAGFQYITSQGNPDQAAKAQSTIINALIGLAIAAIAIVAVSWLGSALGA